MGILGLLLGIIGLVVGIIGAWPRLVELYLPVRSTHSARAMRAKKQRETHMRLLVSDIFYFLTYAIRNGIIGFGLLWLTLSIPSTAVAHPIAFVALTIVRLVASLASGLILGGVTGSCIGIMRHKRGVAGNGG
jgi:hypothetical protein